MGLFELELYSRVTLQLGSHDVSDVAIIGYNSEVLSGSLWGAGKLQHTVQRHSLRKPQNACYPVGVMEAKGCGALTMSLFSAGSRICDSTLKAAISSPSPNARRSHDMEIASLHFRCSEGFCMAGALAVGAIPGASWKLRWRNIATEGRHVSTLGCVLTTHAFA